MSRNDDVKAGKYELLALRWDKVLSKPGEPFDFKRWRRGDVVDLDVEEARRLVKAGAVKPVEAKKSAPTRQAAPAAGNDNGGDGNDNGGDELDISASIDKITAWVGNDQARAVQALEAEQAKPADDVRSTLIEKLTPIANPAS